MTQSFFEVLGVVRKDKSILLYAFCPVLIGIIFYALLWTWPFYSILKQAKVWVEEQAYLQSWTGLAYYILMGMGLALFWLVISWTFILCVSLVSGPFNDIISARVEKVLKGEPPLSVNDSFWRTLGRIKKVMLNEIKKILCVLLLSFVAFITSWIPLLFPLSIALSALLVAASFLDYNWGRLNIPLKECIEDIKSSIIPYGLSGGIFLFFISIPFINLITLPYAVIYYTILFSKQNQ